MTLLIGIITPWGYWMSADNRVIFKGGRIQSDTAPKTLEYHGVGGRFVMTYTGLAIVGGRTTIEWTRSQLGLDAPVEEVLKRLTDQANSELVSLGEPIVFRILEIHDSGEHVSSTIRNVDDNWAPTSTFGLERRTLRSDDAFSYLDGSAAVAVSARDAALIAAAAERRPAHALDNWNLLEEVNRRTAEAHPKGTSSATCVVMYEAFDKTGSWWEMRPQPLDPKLDIPAFILHGMDLTPMGQQVRGMFFDANPDSRLNPVPGMPIRDRRKHQK